MLWGVAAALAVAVIGVAAFRAWPLLHPPVSDRAPLVPACDLRAGPCSVPFVSGGNVTLAIEPRGIPAVHPLQLQVTLRNLPPPQRVEIDFAGVDMDMGFNRAPLQRDGAPHPGGRADGDQTTGDHPDGSRVTENPLDRSRVLENRLDPGEWVSSAPSRWTGQGMLPVCVRGRMTWEARVLLHYPGRLLAAPFRFDSLRPGAR